MGYPVTVNEGTGTDVVNISRRPRAWVTVTSGARCSSTVAATIHLNVYDQNDTSSTDTIALASTNWYVYRPGAAYTLSTTMSMP